MKKSQTRAKLFRLFLTFVLVGGAIPFTGLGQTVVVGPRTEVISQPGSPVEISDLSISSNIVTEETVLDYALTNRANEPLGAITLFVLLFGSDGEAVGGQLKQEQVDVAPGERQPRELSLSNFLYVDPTADIRTVVAVESVQAGALAWMTPLSTAELVEAMEAGTPIPIDLTTQDVSASAATCGLDFCDKCREAAQEDCKCGIKKFSCSLSKCDCSFECFPCRQPPIGEP